MHKHNPAVTLCVCVCVCGLTLPVLLGDWDFVSSRLQVVGFDHAHFLLEYLRHTGGEGGEVQCQPAQFGLITDVVVSQETLCIDSVSPQR